jgi:hypothetical protein
METMGMETMGIATIGMAIGGMATMEMETIGMATMGMATMGMAIGGMAIGGMATAIVAVMAPREERLETTRHRRMQTNLASRSLWTFLASFLYSVARDHPTAGR